MGPKIRVSGVRSSWLTLLKNVVFARSSSASPGVGGSLVEAPERG
jgi:hypothetical protein